MYLEIIILVISSIALGLSVLGFIINNRNRRFERGELIIDLRKAETLCREKDEIINYQKKEIKRIDDLYLHLHKRFEANLSGNISNIINTIANHVNLEGDIDSLSSQLDALQKSFLIMEQQRNTQCEIVNRVHILCNKVEAEKGLMGWISVDIIRGCLNGSLKNVA